MNYETKKNAGKEPKEHRILLKRTEKNARTLRSFEKNGCPTLVIRDVGSKNKLMLEIGIKNESVIN